MCNRLACRQGLDALRVAYHRVKISEHMFGRQALPMVWDYAEVNPFRVDGGRLAQAA